MMTIGEEGQNSPDKCMYSMYVCGMPNTAGNQVVSKQPSDTQQHTLQHFYDHSDK